MGNDDYTSAIGGGLKLKGSKPSGVKKKKKKPRASPSSSSAAALAAATEAPVSTLSRTEAPTSTLTRTEAEREIQALEAEIAAATAEDGTANSEGGEGDDYKTPTERRHEEMRRKRLEERLKREGGIKTHKQRVEELNRYLSGLSEHHDMPRIGPG